MFALALAYELFVEPGSTFRDTLLLPYWLGLRGEPPPLEMEDGHVKHTVIFVPPKTVPQKKAKK